MIAKLARTESIYYTLSIYCINKLQWTALHPKEFISLNSSDLLEHLAMLLPSTLPIHCYLINFLNKDISIINFAKTFSKFYRWYYDVISKFHVGLKSLLCPRLLESEIYGDLMFKLKKIVGSNYFSGQFVKIISHYKSIGYKIKVLKQTACLMVNPQGWQLGF